MDTTTTADDTNISQAEKTRRDFIEQSKLRKAAIEQRKLKEKAEEDAKKVQELEKEKEVQKANDIEKEKEAAAADLSSLSLEELLPKLNQQMSIMEKIKLKKLIKQKETELLTKNDQASSKDAAPQENPKTAPGNESTSQENQVASPEEAVASTDDIPSAADDPSTSDDTSSIDKKQEPLDDGSITYTTLLKFLENAKPIDDIFNFAYPQGIENPDVRYKKDHIKYTYGPAFLLQFKDKVNVTLDNEWASENTAKIVIPAGLNKQNRSRDNSNRFGANSRNNSTSDFRRSGSMRSMDGRNSSKRRSKRGGDDRRSNRSYTSRRDRERENEEKTADETSAVEVAPLVPSANRWVPKSRMKQTEKNMAPDGVTELLTTEEAERNTKSLLNKLTLEKFDPISAKLLAIANQSQWEENGETLQLVIEQVFRKACDEPHWSSMYAQLCGKIVKELNTEIKDTSNEGKTGPKLVLHYLVVRCHTEFEKGWADKLPTKEDGSPLEPEMMSDEYYQIAAAKRRGLGLVRFIGFLYCLNLLTGKMMFECFRRLMKDLNNNPSDETLESVVELLNTVGSQFESDRFTAGQVSLDGSALFDSLFALLQNIIDGNKTSSRISFKLLDVIELRDVKHWNNDKKDEGPKTIQQIHEEEERRRQLKASASSSRQSSRRGHNNSTRNSSRREPVKVSHDDFITTRSGSSRRSQRPQPVQKEELRPTMSSSNMFSALMDNNDDE
ncbi:hypothetical protein TBLA_0B09890 [Henningerozyma blattae CBS 6284]|uniref:MIF4G domain-containing protein n=1 Tax=Henningerozyma blattae (strain ATCC 34711 / CBS 6284 / DSM 70876 / NBRC 10599 / NRRL Y-10934 / UCD 77-7) TaxID=1071380 RepID=I2H0A5_HENB6|nr:hypothetical protein TBLA_0B09890 [Tetrapisispora blattae CBS 6284]CCH59807.1 hypothetical protein TBLA_0B09890 [Tetrapisispora blattae CBS 6284]